MNDMSSVPLVPPPAPLPPPLPPTQASFSGDRNEFIRLTARGAGLELVDHPVRAFQVPIGLRAVPPAVEPEAADRAVICAELAD